MKRCVWICLLLVCLLLPLSVWGEGSNPSLLFETESLEMGIGSSVKLSYTLDAPLTLGKPVLTWSSIDPDIASVNNGTITAKAEGKTQIWLEVAYGDGTSLSAGLQVDVFVPVKSLSSDLKSLEVGAGMTSEAIPCTVLPENARYKTVIWQSDNEEIARVNEDGTVQGLAPGKATITAVPEPHGPEQGKAPVLKIAVTVVQLSESVAINPKEMTVAVGKTAKAEAEVTPGNTSNKKVSWESSDPSVATVANGTVKGVAPGTATIRAIAADGSGVAGESTVTVIVPVKKLSLNEKQITLTAGQPTSVPVKVEPENASNPAVVWSSSDPDVAIADENGMLLGLKEGACTMQAVAADGSGAKTQLAVVVEPYIDLSRMQRVTLSAGDGFVLGIREDGTVIAVGKNDYKQCDVKGWRDIVSVSAGFEHSLGLQSNGHVVAAGRDRFEQLDVEDWRGIIAIAAGGNHSVGLKSDGTVVATGLNDYGQCNVSGWRDIVAISAGVGQTLGLKSDGTVVAAGTNKYGECNVSGWKDIAAISTGTFLSVGLQKNGRVVWTGGSNSKYHEVYRRTEEWRDIVFVKTCWDGIIGLDKDGKAYESNLRPFPEGTYIMALKDDYSLKNVCMLEDGTIRSDFSELNGVKLRLPGNLLELETGNEEVYSGVWIVGDYVNASGKKTGEHYVGTMMRLTGSFDNAYTQNADLQAVILYDRTKDESALSGIYESIAFDLYENNETKVSNPLQRTRYFEICVWDKNNVKYDMRGHIFSDDTRIYLDSKYIQTLLKILKDGGNIQFRFIVEDQTQTCYRFSIPDADGFGVVYDRYVTFAGH